MANFNKWCDRAVEKIDDHEIDLVSEQVGKRQIGIASVAAVVPGHYASTARIAHVLRKLGKTKAAGFIAQKLPTSKNLRSGDLGEIVATSYVREFFPYTHAVNRLRWKDHREMAMRGDDLIAVRQDAKSKRVEFLKGEVKSRVSLTAKVISDARKALRKDNNRPSPHALSFIADRLYDQGEIAIADAIDEAQLKDGIKLSQVQHLLFTFSENNPLELLKANLAAYNGNVAQRTVGLFVDKHQKFIKAIYDKVIANGKHD